MSEYPLLSEQELESMPIFNSLEEAANDPESAYSLELSGEIFSAEEFEEYISELPRLQIIVIDSNDDLNSIPDGIGNLHNLQYLEVRNCPLESVSPSLGECKELGGLVLSDVRPLEELPEELGQLNKLEFVEVSGTNIGSLPTSFSNWGTVTELNLMNNKMNELPQAVGGMSSLETLRTYGNYAMYIGEQILGLKELTTFDHGMINFRNTTEEEVKAALPNLSMTQVTTDDPVKM